MLNIIDLSDGQTITEPGAYRCSMTHYHSAEICPGPDVSSTGLRKIVLQSPHAFWKTYNRNPDRYPEKEPSDSLILGRAAHSLILGDEVFEDHFIFVPEDAPRRPTVTQVKAFERDGKWSDAAAEGAAFWEAFDNRAAGRHLLTPEQHEKICYMAENLAANPHCVELLKSDLIEISMIWQDEPTGIWVKSRPDCIPTNGADYSDLKTFSPKGADLKLSAMRSITDFGYPMQMALGVMGAEQVFGTTATECALVFVQTTEPYECIPIRIDADSLYWARILCRQALDTMADCLKAGEWPGIGSEITTYAYPPSMSSRFAQMQMDGLLPANP
jgi:hypothetical protein